MSAVFLGMKTDQIREVMEDVHLQAEKKLEQTLVETIENAKRRAGIPVDRNNVYSVANQIAVAAYRNFESWAAQTFTISPSKEIAEAWVKGSYYRFGGAMSIQKEIRKSLLT